MDNTNHSSLQDKVKAEISVRCQLINDYIAEVQSLESEINGIVSTIDVLKKAIAEKPQDYFSLLKDHTLSSKKPAITAAHSLKTKNSVGQVEYGLCRKNPKYDGGINPYPFEISQDKDLLGFFVLKAICKHQIVNFNNLFEAVSSSLQVIGKATSMKAVMSKLKFFQSKGIINKFSHKYTLYRDVEFKT